MLTKGTVTILAFAVLVALFGGLVKAVTTGVLPLRRDDGEISREEEPTLFWTAVGFFAIADLVAAWIAFDGVGGLVALASS